MDQHRCGLCDQYKDEKYVMLFRYRAAEHRLLIADPQSASMCGVRYVCHTCARMVSSAFASLEPNQRLEESR